MNKNTQILFFGFIFLAALTLINCTAPSLYAQKLTPAAQTESVPVEPPTTSPKEYQKWEVFGGYSYMRLANFNNMNGFETAVTRNVSRYVGLKFDFSGNYSSVKETNKFFTTTSKRTVYNYLGGIQIKDNYAKTRFKPFGHVLIGANTFTYQFNAVGASVSCAFDCFTKNTFTRTSFTAGGGIDIRINRKIDIRPIQVDYNGADTDGWINSYRIGAGIVYHP